MRVLLLLFLSLMFLSACDNEVNTSMEENEKEVTEVIAEAIVLGPTLEEEAAYFREYTQPFLYDWIEQSDALWEREWVEPWRQVAAFETMDSLVDVALNMAPAINQYGDLIDALGDIPTEKLSDGTKEKINLIMEYYIKYVLFRSMAMDHVASEVGKYPDFDVNEMMRQAVEYIENGNDFVTTGFTIVKSLERQFGMYE